MEILRSALKGPPSVGFVSQIVDLDFATFDLPSISKSEIGIGQEG